VVSISTLIPRSRVFRFKFFWLKHQDYQSILTQNWDIPTNEGDKAKLITAKLKRLRKCLRDWQASMTNLKTTIANVRITILFLEVLADHRDLCLPEWNFKRLLEDHLLSLLEKQRLYWKQRGNIKWVQLGDAGTHFFHTNATIRHRSKLINELTNRDEAIVTSHKDKEALLWEEFKQRMGISDFKGFTINLEDLIQRNLNLHHLEAPFTSDEIDNIIKSLPNNKSPGPDGFNSEFMKASWTVIKKDFYDLCRSFHDNSCCLQSINSSHITLIPKTKNATYVNDYRPISLLNSSMKLLTKLLANRLQATIIPLVHKNQYGFIKSRTIQDCIA